MADREQLVERRKHERFSAEDGALAVLRRSWPHPTTLGQIIDISMGGLAFRCIADEERSDWSSELSIMLTDSSFYLPRLPIEPVSDFETAKMPSGCVKPGRCSVQFKELTDKQGSQLKYFIRNHTTGEAWVNDSAYVIPFIQGSINALLVSGMMWGLIILIGYYLFS